MVRKLPRTTIVGLVALAACQDVGPGGPNVKRDFANYVSIGTSVSMGWQSEGVSFASQEQSWPKLLASAAGVSFTVPGIAAPGCKPPLMAPLSSFKRVDNTSVFVPTTVCSGSLAGVIVPSNNMAVENATAVEALNATSATATQGRGPVTALVLPPGRSQAGAMRAAKPTFVSVELGGNEILPAQVGVLAPGQTYTPFVTFQAAYAKIIDSVKATGAKAVLVGLPVDLRQFPTIRSGAEVASQRAVLAAMHVSVNADCDASANFIFVRGKILTAIATGAQRAGLGAGPYDLSCADVPGTQDYVITPADMTFINSLAVQINAEIASQALANRYAFFSLESLYATSKAGVPFSVQAMMTTSEPYGPKISLDGVHPNALGHKILANAAIDAINANYGYLMPRLAVTTP